MFVPWKNKITSKTVDKVKLLIPETLLVQDLLLHLANVAMNFFLNLYTRLLNLFLIK